MSQKRRSDPNEETKEKRATLKSLFAGLALLTTWFLFLNQFMGSRFMLSTTEDNEFLLGPTMSSISRIWQTGGIPLRSSDFLLGFPLYNWAQITPWYPFYGFQNFQFTDLFQTLHILTDLTLIHILFMLCSCYYMLRLLGASRLSSWGAASVFCFSANFYSYSIWLNLIAPYSWMPMVIAGFLQITRKDRRLIGFSMMVFSLSMMVTASPAQPLIHTALMVSALTIANFLQNFHNSRTFRDSHTLTVLLACLTSVLITLPILIPAMKNRHLWIRWVGNFEPTTLDKKMSFEAFDKWKFQFSDLDQIFYNKNILMVGSGYIGGVTLFFAAFFFLRKISTTEKTMVFIAIYSLVSSLGSNTPLGNFNYLLPLLDTIREQSRHLVVFQFMVMIFMALGIDKLVELKTNKVNSRQRAFLSICLLTLFAYAVLGMVLDRLSLVESSLVFILVLLILFASDTRHIYKKRIKLIVTTTSSVTAILFCFLTAPWTPTQSYSTSVYKTTKMEGISNLYKVIKKMDPQSEYRVLMRGDFQKGFAAMLGGYSGIRTLQYYINPAPLKQAVDADFNGVVFGDFTKIEYRYFALLGTRFVICDNCKEIENDEFDFIVSDSGYKLYENVNARPYVYSGKSFTGYTDRRDLLTKITNRSDFQENWILTSNVTAIPRMASACNFNALKRSSSDVSIWYDCETPGVLVLNEYHDSKWQATVNGMAWPIVEVNGNQNGVVLEAGKGNLTFKYKPAEFYVSLVVSLMSSVVLILILSFFGIRRLRTGVRSTNTKDEGATNN